jgi:hypothetical protein
VALRDLSLLIPDTYVIVASFINQCVKSFGTDIPAMFNTEECSKFISQAQLTSVGVTATRNPLLIDKSPTQNPFGSISSAEMSAEDKLEMRIKSDLADLAEAIPISFNSTVDELLHEEEDL